MDIPEGVINKIVYGISGVVATLFGTIMKIQSTRIKELQKSIQEKDAHIVKFTERYESLLKEHYGNTERLRNQ